MTSPETAALRRTALNAAHRRLGAKMVSFGGWDMPVEYAGIVAEHTAVRTAAGLFDVSHMGELEVRGPHALELVQWVTSNDAAKLADNQAQYTGLMTDRGTFVDDLLVHRFGPEHYFLCVNAANQDADFEHLRANNRFGARLANVGAEYTQLALQGPKAEAILARLTKLPLAEIQYYHFAFDEVNGVRCLVARTGYTGEDGFELYFPPEHSEGMWNDILDTGQADGLIPCGLGARNTLRLEAAFCLYGHEIDTMTTPWEARLGWITKLDKGDFLGREVLRAQKERGPDRILVGFEMADRQIARDGCTVLAGGKEIGRVTSGSPAPFLRKNIGMAYVPPALSAPGTEIAIGIRGREAPARVVALPFYRRPK